MEHLNKYKFVKYKFEHLNQRNYRKHFVVILTIVSRVNKG